MDGELENMMPEFDADAEGVETETEVVVDSLATEKPALRLLNTAAKSPEEVLAYAAELERKQIEAEAKLSAFESVTSRLTPDTMSQPTSVVPSDEELNKKYAERMFSEPATVLKEFAQDIENRLDSKKADAEKKSKFWNDFYNEYDDLSGLDDIVQLQLYKNQEQWKKVPVGQARKLLANATRAYVEKIRDLKTPTETLSSAPAATAGATRGMTPKVDPPSEPTRFIDQLRKVNRK